MSITYKGHRIEVRKGNTTSALPYHFVIDQEFVDTMNFSSRTEAKQSARRFIDWYCNRDNGDTQ